MTRGQVAGLVKRYRDTLDTKEEITVEATENTQEITSKSSRITTLQQLIDSCNIDLEEWIIERHVINKWEVGAKNSRDELQISPLFQVKAWLTKRHPDQITPVVQPVDITINVIKQSHNKPERTRNIAVTLGDPHFGFSMDMMTRELTPMHDRSALSVALQIVKDIQPDVIVWKGDILDLPDWSDKFLQSPEFHFTTQPAIVEASWWLSQFVQSCNAENIAVIGNHGERIDKALMKHVISAYGLRSADNLDIPVMSLRNLLALDKIGVYWAGSEHWITDNIRVIHGDIAKTTPGATAKAINDRANETTIFGHIHRTELTSRTIHTRNGQRTITAFCPGCLCRVDGVVPPGKLQNWQQGFAVLHYDDNNVQIDPVSITGGIAYHGREYVGEFDRGQLENDTGYRF